MLTATNKIGMNKIPITEGFFMSKYLQIKLLNTGKRSNKNRL